jgi:hypothetical protein
MDWKGEQPDISDEVKYHYGQYLKGDIKRRKASKPNVDVPGCGNWSAT